MHADHQVFLDALAAKRRLSVRFLNRKEGTEQTRICAPLDFGPLRGSVDTSDRYQLWDLEGKRKPFNITLVADEVMGMTLLEETFEPAEIITWAFKPRAWKIRREWGDFS